MVTADYFQDTCSMGNYEALGGAVSKRSDLLFVTNLRLQPKKPKTLWTVTPLIIVWGQATTLALTDLTGCLIYGKFINDVFG